MNNLKWFEKFEKGSEKFYMFMDFWNIVQNFWKQDDTDEYWDALCDEVQKFNYKYHNYFAMKLMNAFLDEQERKLKGWGDDFVECLDKEQEERWNGWKKNKHV